MRGNVNLASIITASILVAAVQASSNSTKAERLNPEPSKDPAANEFYEKGLNFLKRKDFVGAEISFRQAALLDKTNPELHRELSFTLYKLADYKESLAEADKAHKLNPQDVVPLYQKADCLILLGRSEQAIEVLNQSLTISQAGEAANHARDIIQTLRRQTPRPAHFKLDYLDELDKGTTRWASMPIRFFVEPSPHIRGFRPELIVLLKQSLSEWQSSSQNKISFRLVRDASNANVIFRFTDKKSSDRLSLGSGEALTVTTSNGLLRRVEVFVSTISAAGTECSANDVHRSMLHEIGHALGVVGHSHNCSDVMFPFTGGIRSDTESGLSTRDANTIRRLYSIEWKRSPNRKSF